MRDALKNLFSQQITLDDNSQYYYSINPYELTNPLANVIAVLQEYNFTKKDDRDGKFTCKLYKTKDGNWYDIEEVNKVTEKDIIRNLKSAVDANENKALFQI